jgi:hypothetical protein
MDRDFEDIDINKDINRINIYSQIKSGTTKGFHSNHFDFFTPTVPQQMFGDNEYSSWYSDSDGILGTSRSEGGPFKRPFSPSSVSEFVHCEGSTNANSRFESDSRDYVIDDYQRNRSCNYTVMVGISMDDCSVAASVDTSFYYHKRSKHLDESCCDRFSINDDINRTEYPSNNHSDSIMSNIWSPDDQVSSVTNESLEMNITYNDNINDNLRDMDSQEMSEYDSFCTDFMVQLSIKRLNGATFYINVAYSDLSVRFVKSLLSEQFGYDNPNSYSLLCQRSILSDERDIILDMMRKEPSSKGPQLMLEITCVAKLKS